MDQVTSESCYKGTILQRNFRKMIIGSFSLNFFVKFHDVSYNSFVKFHDIIYKSFVKFHASSYNSFVKFHDISRRRVIYATFFCSYPCLIVSNSIFCVQTNLNKICLIGSFMVKNLCVSHTHTEAGKEKKNILLTLARKRQLVIFLFHGCKRQNSLKFLSIISRHFLAKKIIVA